MTNARSSAGNAPSTPANAVSKLLSFGALPIVLIICIIIFQIGNPRFLSAPNVLNMTQQAVYLLLIAFGQMLVLLAGGFDLSVGAVVALTSIVSAKVMVAVSLAYPDAPYLTITAGFLATMLVGLACGWVNGFGVAIMKVNAFIVTLATSSIFAGVTLVTSQGIQVSGLPRDFVYGIGSGYFMGLPVSLYFAVPAVAAVFLLVRHMRFGRYIYAIGSNVRSAVVAGVNINRYLMACYMLCATMTAFAGWLLTARVSSGEPMLGGEFPLQSIAAAVIGGCSLRGGEGSPFGVLLGVIFITVVKNGMDLLRIGSNYQMIVFGVVLVGAVVLDRYRLERAAKR
ncbi:ABC transporter permease [Jiella sp. MQZ9-1]|uniref:ABC transporter permease n=1 Tax=Jiella flava TaxID=2816857 RepID=A0A939FWF4_9HYPH|nr:ABC transporter permease [Jiella flava]MBO0661420.1 ABC transporter permease [Jiella flava]MCD2470063.1 ABC transporter permease [Jiella flava]